LRDLLSGHFLRMSEILERSTTLHLALLGSSGEICWINRTMAAFLNDEVSVLCGRNLTEFLTTFDIEMVKGIMGGTWPMPDESTLVNFLLGNTVLQTLHCSFVPVDSAVLLIAEPVLDDNRLLQEELLQLNNQLTVLTRENIRKGRELNKTVRTLSEEIVQRQKAEVELLHYQSHLEELVHERTAELEIARDAAEAASRTKSNFLATMSHELRTPMNAIIGMSHVVRRDSSDPVQQQRLDNILLAAQNLLAIITDVLDFSKIETGALSLETTEFDLSGIVTAVAAVSRDRAYKKGLEFSIDHAGLPARLVGDGKRLEQILLQFCDNAVKFTASGGITLQCRITEKHQNSAVIRFEVTDSGIGLDERQQSRLFQVFEQIDNSSTRAYGGTGLGLAICRRLAELMGGTVGVVSSPGQGSTFWFEAPFGVIVTSDFIAADAAPQESSGLAEQEAEPDVADIDWKTINESIASLRSLLGTDDAGAVKFYHSVKKELKPALGPVMQTLGRYIEKYQFENALNTLNEIISSEANYEP
ncbi:MAG: ATP-binding protein, partial [Deltaproteobacteria bacterium]